MTAGRAGTTAALVLFGSVAAATAAPRVLTQTVPASGLERVALHAGVGDVRVQAGGDDAVVVEVALEPRRGGLFSSLRQAEREVQDASLEVATEGGSSGCGSRPAPRSAASRSAGPWCCRRGSPSP